MQNRQINFYIIQIIQFLNQKKYNWTQYETNQLIYLLNNKKKRPKWGPLSLCFPGRNGQQLYTKFKELESHELIKPFNNTLNICQGAFIMNQELEEELAAVILQRYNNKTQTSLKWFRKYAQEFYFLPNSLAKTAAINHFKKMDLTFIKVMDIQNNL